MASLPITYRIKLSKKVTETFEFQLDDKTGNLVAEAPKTTPAWTALSYQQCSHCPLRKEEHPQCPLAVQLNRFVERFHNTSSIDEVELEVITEERRVSQTVPLQRAVASMLGLAGPTCGCPKTAYMKPMARFHLPLSTEEETLFRVAGMYLLAHHLMEKNSRIKSVANFSSLKGIYEELHIVNKSMANRLRGATESDSSKNAIALLDMYSSLMPMMVDDQMPALSDLFSAYYAGPLPTPKPSTAVLSLSLMAIEEPKDAKAEEDDDVPVLQVQQPNNKVEDAELQDLLNQKEFVSELEMLLNDESSTKPALSLEPTSTPDKPALEKPKGRAVFKLADD